LMRLPSDRGPAPVSPILRGPFRAPGRGWRGPVRYSWGMSDTKAPNADRGRGRDDRATGAARSARYGDTNRRLPGKLIVVGIVGVRIVPAAYIFVQRNRVSAPDVSASQAGWAREEGREDDVFIFTLDVTREDPSLDAYCVIYALNYDVA